jgi:hypothetical protein
MPTTKKDCAGGPPLIEIYSYKFQILHNFTYLGSELNCKNDISVEVRKKKYPFCRLIFYGRTKHLKSKLISRKTKLLMYKTPVRPVLTYAPETWMLSKADERS